MAVLGAPGGAGKLPIDIQQALDEALRLERSALEIVELASKVSEEIANTRNALITGGTNIGRAMAAMGASGGAAFGVGAAFVGAALLFEAIKKKMAEAERLRALAEILEKKKEIATAKLDVVQHLGPRLEKISDRLSRVLAKDAPLIIPDDAARQQEAQASLDEVFRALARIHETRALLTFLEAEFAAWQRGEQTSGKQRPLEDQLAKDVSNYLLESSKIPRDLAGSDMPDQTPEGLIYALHKPDLVASLAEHPIASWYAGAAATRRVITTLLPFGKSARRFDAFYRSRLRFAPLIEQRMGSRLKLGGGVLGLAATGFVASMALRGPSGPTTAASAPSLASAAGGVSSSADESSTLADPAPPAQIAPSSAAVTAPSAAAPATPVAPVPPPLNLAPLPDPPGARALADGSGTDRFLRRWFSSITDRGSSLEQFYSVNPRFRASGNNVTSSRIRTYFTEMLDQGGDLQVDWSRTRTQVEEPGAEPSATPACTTGVPDASGPVTKVRLWLREFSPSRSAAVGCPQLEGVYLLRLRDTPSGPRICHETWSLREGVCYSCPTATVCSNLPAAAPAAGAMCTTTVAGEFHLRPTETVSSVGPAYGPGTQVEILGTSSLTRRGVAMYHLRVASDSAEGYAFLAAEDLTGCPSLVPAGGGQSGTLTPVRFRASSFIGGSSPHPAADAFDGNPRTAWNEFAPGDGTGEWIEATFDHPVRITAIRMSTGWDYRSPTNGDLLTANSHLRRVAISFDGGHTETLDVGEAQRSLDVSGLDVVARTVWFRAEEVYPGDRWEDLCISEIQFEGEP